MLSAAGFSGLDDSLGENGASRHAEANLAALCNHIPEGFLALDADLRIIAVNPALEGLLRSSASQMIGDLLQDHFPGLGPVMIEQLRRTLRTGEEGLFESRSTFVQGRIYGFRVFPYGTGVAALISSRSEDLDLQERLAEAAAFRATVEAICPLVVAKLNVRGLIISANAAFTELTGFSIEHLVGVRLTDLLRPAQRHAAMSAIEDIMAGRGPQCFEASILTKGDVERPLKLSLAGLSSDDGVGGIMMTGLGL